MISEETLILYFYDELPELDKQKVAQAIADDDVLAARYATLSRELDAAVDATPAVEVPEHLVHQWHDTIDQAAQMERQKQQKPGMHFKSFFWGAAVAAAVALAVIGSGYLADDPTMATPEEQIAGTTESPTPAVPVAFTRGLQNHLQYSLYDLDNLSDADDQDMLIMQIVEQNRLFEKAAEQNNANRVA